MAAPKSLRTKGIDVVRQIRRLRSSIVILEKDCELADKMLASSPEGEVQFWRRTSLRCVAAYVEGTLSLLRQMCPVIAEFAANAPPVCSEPRRKSSRVGAYSRPVPDAVAKLTVDVAEPQPTTISRFRKVGHEKH